jgi:hypothetical protein
VLFVVSGSVRRRRVSGDKDAKAAVPASTAPGARPSAGQLAPRTAIPPAATVPAKAPAKTRKGKNAADDDDDLADVADILRRHGIT